MAGSLRSVIPSSGGGGGGTPAGAIGDVQFKGPSGFDASSAFNYDNSISTLTLGSDLFIRTCRVGSGASGDTSNTAMGDGSLGVNGSGTFNSCYGNSSGASVNGGTYNNLFGFNAGRNIVDGNYNIAFGDGALYNAVSNSYNLAICHDALSTLSGGEHNYAIGYLALTNLSNNSNNIAFGTEASKFLSDGYFNLAIGNFALYGGSANHNDVAIGHYAQSASTTNQGYNVSVGNYTLHELLDATSNTAMGDHAGFRLQYGSGNSIFGSNAYFTPQTGYNNSIFGLNAAIFGTTSSNNVVIGANCATNLDGDGNVFIGANIAPPAALSNTIAIGTGDGVIRVYFTSDIWNFYGDVFGSGLANFPTGLFYNLDVTGNIALPTRTVSASYTATDADYTILVNAFTASRTITLPAAATCPGRIYNIKKIDSSVNSVTIDGNASETIDGVTTKSTTVQWFNFQIQSDGTSWFIL